MSKRILALVLAFALVFSSFSAAFADTTTISADAAIAKELGMLVGNGQGGVTPEYLATTPTRLQSAIMVLRLRGLEEEAIAFKSENNFPDMKAYAWADGKNIGAYLTAHPELGFIGSNNGNFKANEVIDAQSYYKVMLEALGYKQTTAEVVGQFTWDEVFTFAASKGLTKANVANFTVNDLAAATVEALKAENGKIVTALIAAGKISAEKAAELGLVATNGELKAVKAIANDKVEVEFVSTPAANASAYKIVVKGETIALAVTAVEVESATKAVLTTSAQTAGTAYTVTVGSTSVNFAGLGKNTVAPTVTKVAAVDTNTVEVTFDKVMDKSSATNVANYTLNNGATVKSAALDSARKVVTLTTEGVSANKVYTVKIENVKSSDLVAIKAVSKSFAGKADTKAPVINKLVVVNNERIKVYFTDDHGVNKASAENIANYAITASTGNLEITSVKAIDENEDDYYEMVEITTSTQKAGTRYTVTINNLVDGSVSRNVATKALTKDFIGMSRDKPSPTISGVSAKTDKKIEITFTENNRLDVASATDIANYAFDKDIVVEKAEMLDATDADSKTVVLTTSSMEERKTYKLTISNVADEFGNVMKDTSRTVVGEKEDIIPPYVKSVNWLSSTSVKLVFSESVDKQTAQDPTNYVVNNNLGAVLKASLADDKVTVTLTTPSQVVNKAYEITINNVKDTNGITLANVKASFVSSISEADTTAPEIEAIDTLFNNEIRVTFNEKVTSTSAEIGLDGTTNKFVAVGSSLNDNTTIVFKPVLLDGTTAWTMGDVEYTIDSITGIADLQGNTFIVDANSMPKFYGIAIANDQPEVSTIEQIDAKTIRVVFTEPVITKAGQTQISSATTVKTFNIVADPDALKNNEGYSTFDLTTADGSNLDTDKVYAFDFSDKFTDFVGTEVKDENDTASAAGNRTEFTAYLVDEDAAIIDYVEAVNEKTIKVFFNENISTQGSFKITDSNNVSAGGTLSYSVKDNVVTISLSSALKADEVYTIKPVVGATDIAGNRSSVKDVEFDFVGSNVVVVDYIKGVELINAKTIKVTSTKSIADLKVELLDNNGDAVRVTSEIFANVTLANSNKTATVELNEALLADTNYIVTIGNMTYKFKGIARDGGLAIDNNVIEFSGWNANDYVVEIVYGNVTPETVTASGTPLVFDSSDALGASGLNLSAGDKFVVEVYKKINGAKDGNVLYAKEFTK